MFTNVNRRSTKLITIKTSIYNVFVLFLLTVSMFSAADTMEDWDNDEGAITFIENDLSKNQWLLVQTQIIPIDDAMLFAFFLLPRNEFEACKYGFNSDLKSTALVINGEALGADASCHQKKDGTLYIIYISDPIYLERVVETFKESSNVKVEHDIATFNVSALGFTKLWEIKSKEFKPPITIDLLLSERIAAKGGDAMTQHFLGFCYVTGQGYCPLDYHVAFKWMEMAALQGLSSAQMDLGKMYSNGNGVAKNTIQSAKWFRKAAEQGLPAAQYYLAINYAGGHGVIKDLVTAHMWTNLSAANGFEEAKKLRDILEPTMSRSELEEAYRLARSCVDNNYKGC